MTVFKTYFKVLLKNKLMVGLNFVIFLIMGILFTLASETVGDEIGRNDNLKGIRVGIVYNYESIKNDGLIRYLDESFTIVDIENDEVEIKLALFYLQIQYVLIINEDGYQSYQAPNSVFGHLVENSINSYLNTFNLIGSANTIDDEEEIVNQTIENLNINVEVIFEASDGDIQYLGMYFNFFIYGSIGTVVSGIGVVMLAFNKKTVHDRTIVSSKKVSKRNLYLSLSSFVFSLMVWVATILVAIFIIGNGEINSIMKMFMINSFVITMVAASLGFLVSQFVKKLIVLSAFVSVAALALSFISGAFIPQFLLSDFTVSIARLTPAYWYVLNNDLIVEMSTFNFEPLMKGMLIQIGFVVAFISAALIVSKYKMERK